MKKSLLIGAGTLAIAGIAGLSLAADAYQGNPGQRAPWFSQDRFDAIQKAIDDKDYNAWKSLQEKNVKARMDWLTQKITPDNFPRFAEMHKLMQEGKYDEAAKIRQELGLGQGPIGPGRGYGHCWNDQDDN